MTAQPQETETLELHFVQVWFGDHVIAKYTAERDSAARYAEAMDRRFAGLKITNDIVPVGTQPERALPLPSRRLWEITPH